MLSPNTSEPDILLSPATIEQQLQVVDYFHARGLVSNHPIKATVDHFHQLDRFPVSEKLLNQWLRNEEELRSRLQYLKKHGVQEIIEELSSFLEADYACQYFSSDSSIKSIEQVGELFEELLLKVLQFEMKISIPKSMNIHQLRNHFITNLQMLVHEWRVIPGARGNPMYTPEIHDTRGRIDVTSERNRIKDLAMAYDYKHEIYFIAEVTIDLDAISEVATFDSNPGNFHNSVSSGDSMGSRHKLSLVMLGDLLGKDFQEITMTSNVSSRFRIFEEYSPTGHATVQSLKRYFKQWNEKLVASNRSVCLVANHKYCYFPLVGQYSNIQFLIPASCVDSCTNSQLDKPLRMPYDCGVVQHMKYRIKERIFELIRFQRMSLQHDSDLMFAEIRELCNQLISEFKVDGAEHDFYSYCLACSKFFTQIEMEGDTDVFGLVVPTRATYEWFRKNSASISNGLQAKLAEDVHEYGWFRKDQYKDEYSAHWRTEHNEERGNRVYTVDELVSLLGKKLVHGNMRILRPPSIGDSSSERVLFEWQSLQRTLLEEACCKFQEFATIALREIRTKHQNEPSKPQIIPPPILYKIRRKQSANKSRVRGRKSKDKDGVTKGKARKHHQPPIKEALELTE